MAVKTLLATLLAAATLVPVSNAQPAPSNSAQEPVVRAVFNEPTNADGKSMQAVTVSYPPGGKSAAHHHARSAFIMAYVISGAIRSQVEGEPARVYHAGEGAIVNTCGSGCFRRPPFRCVDRRLTVVSVG